MKRQGRPAKVALLLGEGPLHIEDEKTARRLLIDKAVIPATVAGYRSNARQVVRLVKKIRVTSLALGPITKGEFFQFLLLANKAKMASGESFRSALLHFQCSGELIEEMSCGLDRWAADADVVKAAEGMSYNGGAPKESKPRGMITWEMLADLVEVVRLQYPQLVLPIKVYFTASLRSTELVLMRVGDLTIHALGGNALGALATLMVRKNKLRNAKNHLKIAATYNKDIVVQEALEAIVEASLDDDGNMKATGTPLWKYGRIATGGWCRGDLVKVVNATALSLGWDPELKFVPYSLRHGGVAHITATVGNNPALLNQATRQTEKTRRIYTRTNEARSAKKAPRAPVKKR